MPFKILEKDVRPHVQVQVKTSEDDGVVKQLLIPVDKATLAVVSKLKETAESLLGHNVQAAFITLPRDCHTIRCEADPLFAGKMAGFEAVEALHEPVAAAIAYDLTSGKQKLREEGSNVLVLHVGGGTSEATIMTFVDGVHHVLGARYDPFLGGRDFDSRTTEHFVRLIRDKYGKDVADDSAALVKLRSACELAKKTLSDQDLAEVKVDSLVHGLNLSEPLTRAEFEELNRGLFLRILGMVHTVVSQTEMVEDNDVEVILVGGSTMIPKLRELVKDYFGGKKELSTRLKPDEAVTLGAALYSKHLYDSHRQRR